MSIAGILESIPTQLQHQKNTHHTFEGIQL